MKKGKIGTLLLITHLIFISGCSGSGYILPEISSEPVKFSIIRTNDGVGFINEAGQVVIKQQFQDAQLFYEGLAAVKVGESWGFINHKGEFVIRPIYTRVHPFSEKLALVYSGEESPIFIDRRGNVVIEPKENWKFIGGFKEGLTPVEVKGKWGFINTKGEIAIEPKFDGVRGFSDGLAFVRVGAYEEALVGYIDRSGKLKIPFEPFEYKDGTNFVMNRAIVSKDNFDNDYAQIMLIDKTGKVLKNELSLTCRDDQSTFKEFAEGLLIVRSELPNPTKTLNRCVYIDMQGKIAISPDPKIKIAEPFYEGLASVDINGKWGYINRSGSIVIEPKFQNASRFRNGLAYVKVNAASEGYINHSGQFVWQPVTFK
ncbi:MAG: WG repeat-containing protein [Nostoc sp. S4]|nr:WG repeat-containing protein [Nostoc sp. S4]